VEDQAHVGLHEAPRLDLVLHAELGGDLGEARRHALRAELLADRELDLDEVATHAPPAGHEHHGAREAGGPRDGPAHGGALGVAPQRATTA